MKTMANRQRGVSFAGFFMVVAVLVFAGIVGIKLIPSYMQDGEIKKAFDAIARDPDMRSASNESIRLAFAHRTVTSNINVISEKDIEISKDGNGLSLSASYVVKIPLAANASLLLEFNPSSSK